MFTRANEPPILGPEGGKTMPSTHAGMRVAAAVLTGFVLLGSASGAPTTQSKHRKVTKRHVAAKPVAAPAPTPVEVMNGTTVERKVFDAPSQTPSQIRVAVMNGTAMRTQVFDVAQPAPVNAKKTSRSRRSKHRARTVAPPAEYSVKIINGTEWETRAFSEAETAPAAGTAAVQKAEPVVVNVASSDSRAAQPNAGPVVVGIASSGMQNAGNQPVVVQVADHGTSADRGAEPSVVTGVSPTQPKRPPYHRPGDAQ